MGSVSSVRTLLFTSGGGLTQRELPTGKGGVGVEGLVPMRIATASPYWWFTRACSNDEEQEGKEWQVRTKGTARPVGQRHDAQDDGEAAHLDAVEVAGAIESQHNQPHPNEPGVFRDPPLGHEPEGSDHDQEERPADSL